MEVKGFDELEKGLRKMGDKAKEAEGQVSIEVLCNESFMAKYTSYSSIQELFDGSDFILETKEDFKQIPNPEWDAYIAKVTKFDCWDSMLGKASQEYVARKMGLL